MCVGEVDFGRACAEPPAMPRIEVLSEGVEEAEEHSEPGVPGEDAPAHLRAVLTIWQGMSMKAARNVQNSIVRRRRRCSPWAVAHRGETGRSSAHQALRLQAKAAITR